MLVFQTNIKCLNVRGLALISNKVKVNLIEDLLEHDNSIGIILSETWLDESICNAEIQMENFMLFRSDRSNRQRGGVALYLRKELNAKLVSAFSNSVVETLIVTCKKLNTIFISIYRPPSTKSDEWSQALEKLNDEISMIQSNGCYDTIICGGDMNFPNLKWEENLLMIDLELSNQEETFVSFMFANNLMNYVTKPTREENILDLVLTNNYDMITSTYIDVNNGFSDHNTVTCKLNIVYNDTDKFEKIM